MGKWRDIASAPKDGSCILILRGETVPGRPNVRVGEFLSGASCEGLGYREFAKYGGWMIWHEDGGDWFVCDVTEPTHWMPLPESPDAPTGDQT